MHADLMVILSSDSYCIPLYSEALSVRLRIARLKPELGIEQSYNKAAYVFLFYFFYFF